MNEIIYTIMKVLKVVAILLFATLTALLVFSCGSSKKMAKSEIYYANNDSTSKEKSVEIYAHSNLTSLTNKKGVYDVIIKKFDLTKKKDSITGEYPIKEEVIIKANVDETNQTNENKNDSTLINEKEKSNSSIEAKSLIEESTERNEPTTMQQITQFVIDIAVILFLILLFRIFK